MTDFSSIDPQSMAQQLATYDILALQTQLKTQQKTLSGQKTALKALRTALTDFRTALNGLNKNNDGMLQNKATMSKEGYANVTANSSAAKGTYNITVESLASAHQVAFEGMTDDDVKNSSGKLSLTIGGKPLEVDMDTLESLSDLANAINGSSTNPGATASLLRSNGQVTFMLSSDNSGAANEITFDPSSDPMFLDTSKQKVISAASDAKVWLGEPGSGLLQTSSTNTFNDLIKGVNIELTQAQATGDSPLVLTIGTDETASKEQAQKFIDAYNTLKGALTDLTGSGSGGSDRGAFAGDSGIISLERQLNNLLRNQFNGMDITEIGITADKDGKLKLDGEKFDKALKEDPQALTELFNGNSGLIKTMDKSLDNYLSNSNGVLKMRQDTLDRKESQFSDRSDQINTRYDNAYNRYLRQFTQLQSIMSQMNNTMSMFGIA